MAEFMGNLPIREAAAVTVIEGTKDAKRGANRQARINVAGLEVGDDVFMAEFREEGTTPCICMNDTTGRKLPSTFADTSNALMAKTLR